MNIYEIKSMKDRIDGNPYVGRGIVIGKSSDGKKAVTAYFIMGRSANSRNRVFTVKNGEVFTEPFDASKVEDPSLIIYAALRKFENKLIVTNGDQTDTVYDGIVTGKSFSESLESREFEPDSPNYTPRISGIMHVKGCTDCDVQEKGHYNYAMSILKSDDGDPDYCIRNTFTYPGCPAGEARFIHTYMEDANPLPSFEGEPEKVTIAGDIDTFTDTVWESLNEDNKVSLFVRYIDIATGTYETRIVNKNK